MNNERKAYLEGRRDTLNGLTKVVERVVSKQRVCVCPELIDVSNQFVDFLHVEKDNIASLESEDRASVMLDEMIQRTFEQIFGGKFNE